MVKFRTLVAAVAGVVGTGAAYAIPNAAFDGSWSVQVISRQGRCDSYKWNVDVSGGRIAHVQDDIVQATGGIDRHGRVSITLTHGSDAMMATGEMRGKAGAGSWTSESLNCSGEWRAERLPAQPRQ
jgi:hypothetical protein